MTHSIAFHYVTYMAMAYYSLTRSIAFLLSSPLLVNMVSKRVHEKAENEYTLEDIESKMSEIRIHSFVSLVFCVIAFFVFAYSNGEKETGILMFTLSAIPMVYFAIKGCESIYNNIVLDGIASLWIAVAVLMTIAGKT